MSARIYRLIIRKGALCVAGAVLPVSLALAQSDGINQSALLLSDSERAQAEQRALLPVLRIERQAGPRDLQGLYGEERVDINLGLEYRPVDGLSLSADAWRLESDDNPPQDTGIANQPPRLFIQREGGGEFTFEQPFFAPVVETEGIDLGASYSWETDRIGQFTLSTRATYIHDFEQRANLPAIALTGDDVELPGNADLQGSLTLTWQLGNHTASAVTNYFDSVKDISELNMDEINQLVEDITTVDLQYGYNMKAGRQDREVISFQFGIRNIFDKKTTQILNQNSRVVDQNGRVAYGSIKYQF